MAENDGDSAQDGLGRLLQVLRKLDDAGVHFVISQASSEALLVRFTLVGTRVEVEAFPDRLMCRHFAGSEDVHDDMALVNSLAFGEPN
jgi:hypothetical protein